MLHFRTYHNFPISMKGFILISLFCLILVRVPAQTRQADYSFTLSYFTQNTPNDQYKMTNLISNQTVRPGGTKATLEFIAVYSKADNKRRTIAMVYKEFVNENSLSKVQVFCLPENATDSVVTAKCFQDIQQVSDKFTLTYMIWGLMKLSVIK
jgi:hypothetical protein